MAVPNFGDIGADAPFGYTEMFFFLNPGDTTINNNSYLDIECASFSMPFTGDIVLDCAVYGYINSASYQYWEMWATDQSNPDPTTAPRSWWNAASATNSYPIMTLPVKAYWANVSSGTSVVLSIRFRNGDGGYQSIYRTCFGSYRCYRN